MRRALPLFLLGALRLAAMGQIPVPTHVTVQGQEFGSAQLDALAKTTAKSIADLEKSESPNEQTRSLVTALNRQRKAIEALRSLLAEVSDSQQRIRALEDAIKRHSQELALKQTQLKAPPKIESATEKELHAYQAASDKAKLAVEEGRKQLSAAEGILAARRKRFESIADSLSSLQKAREPLEAILANETSTTSQRAVATADLLTNELKQRTLELHRDQHPTLLQIDEKRVEDARIQTEISDLMEQTTRLALAAAREARGRALEMEKAKAEHEAKEKSKEAERQRHPTPKAVATLEALKAALAGLEFEEQSIKAGIERRLEIESLDNERIEERNRMVVDRLPRGARLDPRRRDFLVAQMRRLSRRHTRAEQRFREIEQRHGAIMAKVQTRMDALEAVLDVLADDVSGEDTTAQFSPAEHGSPKDPLAAQWIAAQKSWKEGEASVQQYFTESRVVAFQKNWNQTREEILQTVRRRKALLGDIESLADEEMHVARKALELLTLREDHLVTVSFWLREPWLGAKENREAMAVEASSAVKRFPASFRILKDLPSKSFIGSGLLLALALAGFFVPARWVRSPTEDEDPLTRRLRLLAWAHLRALPAVLLYAAVATSGGSPLPREPALFVLASFFGVFAFLRFFSALLEGRPRSTSGDVVEPTPNPMRRFSRALRAVIALGLLTMVPLIGWCDRAGYSHLSDLLWAALFLWSVAIVVWFGRRAELLRFLVPAQADQPWSRLLQALLRFAWPALVLVSTGLLVFHVLGFRNASRLVGLRSLGVLAVLLASNLTYQFIAAGAEGWTARHRRRHEAIDPSWKTWADRRSGAIRRLLMSIAFALILLGTLLALRWALSLSPESVKKFLGFVVLEGRKGGPSTTLGDLLRGTVVFLVALVGGFVVRDLLLTGGKPADENRRGTRYARATLAFYTIVALGFVLGLRAWGISMSDLGWLLAPAGVAIGFGMTEILSNFVSGLILFLERPLKVGDIITVGDVEGDVTAISIRATVVRTRDGISIIIPNRRLIEENVINWSHGEPRTRLRVSVGTAYGTDVGLAKKVLLEVAEQDRRVLSTPRPEVTFRRFGESELAFELLVWLTTPDITVRRRVLSDLNGAIDAAFRRSGIEIPFPQRDLHIRSVPSAGIDLADGGEEADEAEET